MVDALPAVRFMDIGGPTAASQPWCVHRVADDKLLRVLNTRPWSPPGVLTTAPPPAALRVGAHGGGARLKRGRGWGARFNTQQVAGTVSLGSSSLPGARTPQQGYLLAVLQSSSGAIEALSSLDRTGHR
jgi:hypothetical protein